mmetsp:Transcript_81705/g.252204  ORF Transcript_81705/g.252204 Transcript_81705/m.252204 type:complete len:219 (+) Transcript_81705:1168-1824(+)
MKALRLPKPSRFRRERSVKAVDIGRAVEARALRGVPAEPEATRLFIISRSSRSNRDFAVSSLRGDLQSTTPHFLGSIRCPMPPSSAPFPVGAPCGMPAASLVGVSLGEPVRDMRQDRAGAPGAPPWEGVDAPEPDPWWPGPSRLPALPVLRRGVGMEAEWLPLLSAPPLPSSCPDSPDCCRVSTHETRLAAASGGLLEADCGAAPAGEWPAGAAAVGA